MKRYLIFIGIAGIVLYVAATTDVFSGMLDVFGGNKNKFKPGTQGG
jgi:hypothetical protein